MRRILRYPLLVGYFGIADDNHRWGSVCHSVTCREGMEVTRPPNGAERSSGFEGDEVPG